MAKLKKLGVRVWYDEDIIQPGEQHRSKIDQGIRQSRYVMPLLSPSYISDNRYWTQAELNAAIQIESENGTHIIPLQHRLSLQEIQAYSPMLASKKPIDTSRYSPIKIARQMRALLDQQVA